jgi:hypothetical protein
VETIGSPKDRSMDEELIIGYAETHWNGWPKQWRMGNP